MLKKSLQTNFSDLSKPYYLCAICALSVHYLCYNGTETAQIVVK